MKLLSAIFFSALLTISSASASESTVLNCGKSNGKNIIVTSSDHLGRFEASFRHNFYTSEKMVCSGWDIEKLKCVGYLDGTKNLIEIETSLDDRGDVTASFKQLRGGALEGKLQCLEL